jgi:hypothetical protein
MDSRLQRLHPVLEKYSDQVGFGHFFPHLQLELTHTSHEWGHLFFLFGYAVMPPQFPLHDSGSRRKLGCPKILGG